MSVEDFKSEIKKIKGITKEDLMSDWMFRLRRAVANDELTVYEALELVALYKK